MGLQTQEQTTIAPSVVASIESVASAVFAFTSCVGASTRFVEASVVVACAIHRNYTFVTQPKTGFSRPYYAAFTKFIHQSVVTD
jgi:hypothetical protein